MSRDVTDSFSEDAEGVDPKEVHVGDYVRFLYKEWLDLLVRRIGYVADVKDDSFWLTCSDMGGKGDWRHYASRYRFNGVREYQVITRRFVPEEWTLIEK
jgi:hypothetical protein